MLCMSVSVCVCGLWAVNSPATACDAFCMRFSRVLMLERACVWVGCACQVARVCVCVCACVGQVLEEVLQIS